MIDSSLSLRVSMVLAAAAALALFVAGCGGAAAGESAKAPAAQSMPEKTMDEVESEPTSVEQAEQAIARAKAELGSGQVAAGGLGLSPGEPTADARPSSLAPPVLPQTPQPSAARPYSPQAAPPGAALGVEDRCASPCRALASMRRAVTALCRMTGDEDTRCVGAQHTLTDSEKRVATCTC